MDAQGSDQIQTAIKCKPPPATMSLAVVCGLGLLLRARSRSGVGRVLNRLVPSGEAFE